MAAGPDGAAAPAWQWQGRPVPVRYDERGRGRTVLLLPPFSTVSSRDEMRPLAGQLAGDFRVVVPDWPGFGAGRHVPLEHGPDLHAAFLRHVVEQVVRQPAAVIAAGHAAGYALALARQHPGTWTRIVLVAPTWRGPLPTMAGGRRPWQRRLLSAIRAPGLGHALYRLNVSRPVIAAMLRRHVYADPGRVTPDLLAAKAGVARRPGGRFGSGAFVTGALDPVGDRAAFLALASPPAAPTLLLYGADTPPRSRAEMEALAQAPGIAAHRLDSGALGLAEERAEALAQVIRPFLLQPA